MSDDKSKMQIKDGHDYETTGHTWDGIEEYNKPLPKWWLWTFYACIVWGVGYTIAYPAWPLINSATPGLLGYSTRGEVAQEIAQAEQSNAGINAELASVELAAIGDDPNLQGYAQNKGAAVYRTWCAQCHGSGAAGADGYPNLLDDEWLWGGTMEAIHTTVTVGIRYEDADPNWERQSMMPAFGADQLLSEGEVDAVVNYVMSLSGEPQDATVVAEGAELYDINCAACHGADGQGDRMQGAPNIANAIWLYGGDYDSVYETVWNARAGRMPPMGGADLSEAEIRAVTAYVHSLGGGEAPAN